MYILGVLRALFDKILCLVVVMWEQDILSPNAYRISVPGASLTNDRPFSRAFPSCTRAQRDTDSMREVR